MIRLLTAAGAFLLLTAGPAVLPAAAQPVEGQPSTRGDVSTETGPNLGQQKQEQIIEGTAGQQSGLSQSGTPGHTATQVRPSQSHSSSPRPERPHRFHRPPRPERPHHR